MKLRKTILFTIILLVNAGTCFAQPGKYPFSLYKKVHDASAQSKEVAVFVKGDISEISKWTESVGGIFKYAAGDIAAIRIPVSKVNELAEKKFVTRIEDNNIQLRPLNDQVIINNNVVPVHLGFAPLAQGYDGTGVVMGIIDL